MRGRAERQVAMLLSTSVDEFVPATHPIRRIRKLFEPMLAELSPQFDALYARQGRPSIPPEQLLKASLLMAFYSIRSERQFCERLRFDLLFKWFLGLNIQDPAFHHSTFSKNRQRLIQHEVAQRLLGEVVREAGVRRLISDQHFTVDGTLLQAWASLKSLRPRGEVSPPERKGRNVAVDYHGQKRTNATHVSRTDPEARLARKGYNQETKLSFMGHLFMENRNGLVLDMLVTQATGYAEREAALRMCDGRTWRGKPTLAADKGYDARDFIEELHARGITPHIARNTSHRRSAVDDETAADPGYAISQRRRKLVEEGFGWTKTVGCGRKLRYVGVAKNQHWATMTAVAYNLVRLSNLLIADL